MRRSDSKRSRQHWPERRGHDVAGDEGRGVERPLALAPRRAGLRFLRRRIARQGVAQLLQVADGLLEDVPQDFHVDQPGRLAAWLLLRGGWQAVVVGGEAVEAATNLVRDRQAFVQERVTGEQAAVVAVDAELPAPLVHGAEEPLEVVPDGARIEGVSVPVGAGNDLARQEPAVLTEGDEQNAVQYLLGRGQQVGRCFSWVVATKRLEGLPAQVGVLAVVVARQVQADPVRLGQQVVEMTPASRRHHAIRPEQEDEPAEGGVIVGKRLRLEALKSELVVSLVVQARFRAGW